MIPTALTIAGSDSSGGAGIQADLKTFSALKVYGMSVITALTAQNTTGVLAVMQVPAAFVAEQLTAVVSDIVPAAVKTGMLSTAASIKVIAEKIREYGLTNVVVDPVMTSTSGSMLLDAPGIEALRRFLLPLAVVVTPNIEEACSLTGRRILTPDDMEEAALQIHGLGPKYVLIKGGHLDGLPIDVLFDGNEFTRLHGERIETTDLHGTGCVLSAAMTAHLARGESVSTAVHMAKTFITDAIRNGLRLGKGRGPCDPLAIQA